MFNRWTWGIRVTQRLSLKQVDGETVVVKRAVDVAKRQQLAHEASQLAALQHPGVVGLVSYTLGDSHDTLMTACAGTVTLADYSPADLGAVAGVMAGAAAVVADLHAAGVCHGAIQADHVIIGESRHPVLCSFAQSGPASTEAVENDVAGLVDMVGALTARARMGSRGGTRRQERELRTIADNPRGCPTTAAAVAARLAEVPGALQPLVSPTATVDPDDVAATPPHAFKELPESPLEGTRTWHDRVALAVEAPPPRPRAVRLAAVAAMAALLATALWAGASRRNDGALSDTPSSTAGPLAPVPVIEAEGLDSLPARGPCPRQIDPGVRSDIGRAGCLEAVFVEGNLVSVGQDWYSAGSDGDVVVVGDWDCNGEVTVALLRPPSGEVFIFDSWVKVPGESLEVLPVTRVEGATNLEVRRSAGCDSLYAVDEVTGVDTGPIVVQ